MAYDEKLAERLRKLFKGDESLVEKKMFGGLAYLKKDHMCFGVIDDKVVVRVGPDAYESSLAEPHTTPMDFTGRPMKGYVYVLAQGIKTEKQLKDWVMKGVRFTETLPPKKKKKK